MNEVETIQSLAAAACCDGPPACDPVGPVLREIRRRQAVAVSFQAFGWAAGVAAAAAVVVVGVFGAEVWPLLSDPLGEMLVLANLASL